MPVLEGDGLTVTVAGGNVTGAFQICMKLHVASPVAAGTQQWTRAGVCQPLLTFGATGAKRALFRNSELRGFGSAVGAVGAIGAASALGAAAADNDRDASASAAHHQLSRRAAAAPVVALIGAPSSCSSDAPPPGVETTSTLPATSCGGCSQFGP